MPDLEVTRSKRGFAEITLTLRKGENRDDHRKAISVVVEASNNLGAYKRAGEYDSRRVQYAENAVNALSGIIPHEEAVAFMESAKNDAFGTKLILTQSGDIYKVEKNQPE